MPESHTRVQEGSSTHRSLKRMKVEQAEEGATTESEYSFNKSTARRSTEFE